ncbi:MAG: hypothetical protein WDN28_14470 [Chthoniobacter sp.]
MKKIWWQSAGVSTSWGARYLVCGGFAIILAGYPRFTGDIDLLIDTSLENEAKVFEALTILPDQAVRDLAPGDVENYVVCRVGDEVTVDLMKAANGIGYSEAASEIVVREIQGVLIPFASPELLWRMKRNTHREKDRPDLFFLRQWFEAKGINPPE